MTVESRHIALQAWLDRVKAEEQGHDDLLAELREAAGLATTSTSSDE